MISVSFCNPSLIPRAPGGIYYTHLKLLEQRKLAAAAFSGGHMVFAACSNQIAPQILDEFGGDQSPPNIGTPPPPKCPTICKPCLLVCQHGPVSEDRWVANGGCTRFSCESCGGGGREGSGGRVCVGCEGRWVQSNRLHPTPLTRPIAPVALWLWLLAPVTVGLRSPLFLPMNP